MSDDLLLKRTASTCAVPASSEIEVTLFITFTDFTSGISGSYVGIFERVMSLIYTLSLWFVTPITSEPATPPDARALMSAHTVTYSPFVADAEGYAYFHAPLSVIATWKFVVLSALSLKIASLYVEVSAFTVLLRKPLLYYVTPSGFNTSVLFVTFHAPSVESKVVPVWS